jgi:serine/threonine protein kinase
MAELDKKIGPYTLISKLGRGAFGVVWLAEKRTSIATTRFALKLPKDEDIDLEAVRQEAALWVHASGHPNVLPIIEADVYDNQVMIVSEYAPDGSLAAWLQRCGGRAPSIEAAVEMVSGVLAGLQHLHERQIIHRDLKPDNILLQGETPRLADFGIARLLKSTSHSTQISGTLAYMAPEAFDGKRSAQTDVWAVGVIFYQLLAGCLPFPQTEMAGLLGAIMRFDPPPLPSSVPRSLQEVLARALSRDPAARYKSAAEMRRALREIGQSQTVPLRHEPQTEPWVRREAPQERQETPPQRPNETTPDASRPLTMPIDVATIPLARPASAGRSNLSLRSIGGFVARVMVSALLAFALFHFWPKSSKTITNANSDNSTRASQSVASRPTRAQPVVTTGSWTLARTLTSEKGGPGSAIFSPDSKTLACVWNYVGSPTVKLLDVQTGEVRRTLAAESEWVSSLDFSPDGRLLVGTADKGVRVWDVATGEVKQTLKADDKVYSVSFSPDGAMLASAGDDKRIVFWDTNSWTRKRTIAEGTYVEDIVFSPDGTLIASGPLIKIWDVASGELKRTLNAREGDFPASIAFSPDGKLLASGNLYSKTADVWDVQAGKLLRTFSDFTDYVDCVDFSPDGTLIALRSREGSLKIQNVQTGELVQSLSEVYENHPSGADFVRFSPDGRWLVSGDGRGSFKLWKRTVGTAP